jgi:hypothetical protein
MLRIDGAQAIMSIEELGRRGKWKPCSDRNKEFCELSSVESWTENGWINVERIIRHKLASHKKMVRVLTHTGVVDVTDDHSLLKPDGTEISSKTLNIGDSLLHAEYPPNDEKTIGDVVKARIAGFFVGDGSCGNYDCPSGEKSSWVLNNSNIDMLNDYRNRCQSHIQNLIGLLILHSYLLVYLNYYQFQKNMELLKSLLLSIVTYTMLINEKIFHCGF